MEKKKMRERLARILSRHRKRRNERGRKLETHLGLVGEGRVRGGGEDKWQGAEERGGGVEARENNGRAIIMLIGRETTVARLMGVFTTWRAGGWGRREVTSHPPTYSNSRSFIHS